MHLILLIATLVLDRFTQVSGVLQNYRWFPRYLGKIQQWLGDTFLWKDSVPILCWLLPIVLVTGLIQLLLDHILWGIPGYIFNFIILVYCLGPSDFKLSFGEYFSAVENGDTQAVAKALCVESANNSDANSLSIQASESILNLANRRVLAMMLWFLVFGAFGIILYKFMDLLHEEAEHSTSFATPFCDSINAAMNVLDWVPIRVSSLLYALAGNFAGSFNSWWHHLLTKPSNNQQLLSECGLAALNVQADYTPKNLAQSAVALVDRSIILMLVVVALMTLAAWIN